MNDDVLARLARATWNQEPPNNLEQIFVEASRRAAAKPSQRPSARPSAVPKLQPVGVQQGFWEDPGIRYIWSEQAVTLLVRLGVENWEAVIAKVIASYEQEQKKGTVRNPEGLARTMVRREGLSALRASAIQHKARRRPVVQVPIEPPSSVSETTTSPVDEQPRLWGQPADEAHDEIRDRLRREEEQDEIAFLLETMRNRLAEQLVGGADVICPLHERGCPHAANVLAGALRMSTFLIDAVAEQETSAPDDAAGHQRSSRLRTEADWDQRLHQRLFSLALVAANAEDPGRYGNTSAGRQARVRGARCVLHTVWLEASTVKLEFLAEHARMALEGVYVQQLQWQGTSEPARRRLLTWLERYGPPPPTPRETS